MKVTLREIVDARDSLMNLSSQKLPLKFSYNLSKIIRKANSELEILNKIRQEVISKNLSDGVEMSQEINQKIMIELNEILETEIDISVQKIDLSNLESIELTAREIMTLEPFCIFETLNLE